MPSFALLLCILTVPTLAWAANTSDEDPGVEPRAKGKYRIPTTPDSLPPPTVGVIPAAPRPGLTKTVTPKTPVAPGVKSPTVPVVALPSRAATETPPHMPPTRKAKALSAKGHDSDESEEETTAKSHRYRAARTKAASPERDEPTERKGPWGHERYAAVIPPTLTLSALQQELNKGTRKPTESAPLSTGGSEREHLEQLAAEIEKAREALRQETVRLEALIKASGNCGGNVGMLMGDPLVPSTPVSAASLREAPNEQIDSVSKALKGMKPEQAAAVLARLDRSLAAEVLRRMRPADAGSVMGLIKPELAAELATEIALRKTAPPKKGTGK